jgi:hypothetical protein
MEGNVTMETSTIHTVLFTNVRKIGILFFPELLVFSEIFRAFLQSVQPNAGQPQPVLAL